MFRCHMNKVILQGTIKNIAPSHSINGIEYDKANIIVDRGNGREDIINLKFKKFSNPYKDNTTITLIGNIRTYSQKLEQSNKVEVYVFTYFDETETETTNIVELDGRICKLNPLRKTQAGKDVIDFIIANNLKSEDQSLNCYIPCVAWGKLAKEIATNTVGDIICVKGQLQSREYKKRLSDDNFEIKVAHELNISEIVKDK